MEATNLKIGADVFLASTDSTLFASSALKLLASITNINGLLEPVAGKHLSSDFAAAAILRGQIQQREAQQFSCRQPSWTAVGTW